MPPAHLDSDTCCIAGRKKKSLADFAMVRRIHFIFERAVRKFKTDLTLWTAWLEFCRSSSSNRRLGRVVARALQIHPTGACGTHNRLQSSNTTQSINKACKKSRTMQVQERLRFLTRAALFNGNSTAMQRLILC